jgi:hypothetical protein
MGSYPSDVTSGVLPLRAGLSCPRLIALQVVLLRLQGPSARETRRDVTSFEAARKEWGAAAVSHRGNVGGGGDHGSEVWLG